MKKDKKLKKSKKEVGSFLTAPKKKAVKTKKVAKKAKSGTVRAKKLIKQADKIIKKAKKPVKTESKTEKLKMVNVKLSRKDRKALVTIANKFAKGNISAWLRFAGLKHVPKKSDKISLVYSAKLNSL